MTIDVKAMREMIAAARARPTSPPGPVRVTSTPRHG